MKTRLMQAGLLGNGNDCTEINISIAWTALAKLGFPARYSGKSRDGSFEYLILHPVTGELLTSGKGATLESSICEAALNACQLLGRDESESDAYANTSH